MDQHTAAISVTLTPYFIGLLGVLWAIVLGFGAFWLKRLSDKVDTLIVHKEGCLMIFADRVDNAKDHAELFKSRNDHERRIVSIETRLKVLEERKG
ncbi:MULTISPECIES: hypothetical protein [unclassified Desulfovibrio]|uniref:hypothetical protein n=1 Tax=unclassified Desulfovibrio TaxID=2593640 RepID=UPI0013EDB410|nr:MULTISPECIES: hypothetical protein [unclassified Desulfovibrio]